MLVADFIVVAFTAANLARIFTYLPQIFRIAADQSGAAAISYATWTMFTLSHLTTVAYALVVAADARLAAIFAANALSSGMIVILTWIKRRQRGGRRSGSRCKDETGTEPALRHA